MSTEWKIYHNPRCSKSRQTLGLLEDAGIEPQVIEYLNSPPSDEELRSLSRMLGKPIGEFVRTKETVYAELGLENADEQTLMNAVMKHPVLLERPIVVRSNKAVIGRPPENIKALLDE